MRRFSGHGYFSRVLITTAALLCTPAGARATAGGSATLSLRSDANRDGQLNAKDDTVLPDSADQHDNLWQQQGALLLANLDDDDRDGLRDAFDTKVNGPEDRKDLAEVEITLPPGSEQTERLNLSLKFSGAGQPAVEGGEPAVRVFRCDVDPCEPLSLPAELDISAGQSVRLGLEALRFAGRDWDGRVTLEATPLDSAGTLVAARSQLRVAPWLALPDTAEARQVYVAEGGPYANATFIRELAAVAKQTGAGLTKRTATRWQEMWVQDSFEMGATGLPGRPFMHVVLNATRGRGMDTFGPALLAPDVGFVQIGQTRPLAGGDAWADWMGNLSVTPPMPNAPYGRIYYGRNTATGASFHPDIVAFFEAQELQKPFWLDTSFLTIKHVDEMASFMQGADGKPYLLVASPAAAAAVLGQRSLSPRNTLAQKVMSENLARMQQAVSIASDRVVPMPVLFNESGESLWSNPVNALFVNGTLVAGRTNVPKAIAAAISTRVQAMGQTIFWIDDSVYQNNAGNVHCATNTLRRPPFSLALGMDLADQNNGSLE